MNNLTDRDILGEVIEKITLQDYSKKPVIEGVKIVGLRLLSGEDGTFEELLRLSEGGISDLFPGFNLRQINRSKIVPGAIKAWHLHYSQEDIWYVPPEDHLFLGLWDLRKKSPTRNLKMKIIMGAGQSKLVYIPRGVAHGVANVSQKEATVIYFVDRQFNPDRPDERRLPWDLAGANFWQIKRE
ncbi:MAG: dTDP-4-dehydrorhamnose 3,5-epimerase family protein [Patescibacteria group bacterium]|nr:dTDP-4-dehydrorhamnose 3,5-epimerase family protein [Patescibacteria group bacterium]